MIRIPGTAARYLVKDRVLYIFCRGTSSADPWWRNLLVRRERWHGYRLNWADFLEAFGISRRLPTEGYDLVFIAAFSRGAGPAAILQLMIGGELSLFAPKRVGCRALVRRQSKFARAYRCDIIPLLPPWYASWRCRWSGWMWPWKAHQRAARDAARWRHEVSRG